MKLKLNYKQTLLIGLAFMSISAFWQMYDNVIPLILRDTFGIGDTVSGVIMAADNVIALFLLPLLGSLSDKVDTRIGKRMPFIIVGTGVAVILMNLLPFLDNRYFDSPSDLIRILFIVILGVLLITMATYRSPAVALMPDLTPKPLRSKGNAIINLMGAIGGIFYLLVTAVLYPGSKTSVLEHVDYTLLFIIVSAFMLVSVIALFFTVKEKKAIKAVREYEALHPEDNLAVDDGSGNEVLPKEVKRSLVFILLSISFWFAGYNAVSTAFTKFANTMWGMSLGDASFCLTIAMAGAIITYVPLGFITEKLGRKKTIIAGTIILGTSFSAVAIYSFFSSQFTPLLYVGFVCVGLAWAAINVNSLPMVVEMCKGSDVGKFTGIYYTFSMSAQIITPIISGALLEHVGYHTLFPYAALFVFASTITMSFVKHGDAHPIKKKSVLENFDVDD